MNAGPLWGEYGAKGYFQGALGLCGIDDFNHVIDRQFHLTVSGSKDEPFQVRGNIGLVRLGLGWVEILFAPPFSPIRGNSQRHSLLRGVRKEAPLGDDSPWVPLISGTSLGIAYSWPGSIQLEFKIL